jgi:hypothetical protein
VAQAARAERQLQRLGRRRLPYSSRLLGEVARGFLLDHLTRDAMALQHYLMRSVTRTHVRSKWHRYRTDLRDGDVPQQSQHPKERPPRGSGTAKDHGDLKPTRADAGLCAVRRTRRMRRQVRQGMPHSWSFRRGVDHFGTPPGKSRQHPEHERRNPPNRPSRRNGDQRPVDDARGCGCRQHGGNEAPHFQPPPSEGR